ncbi:MAG: zinc-binding alcohol dehydrogenase, partial [Candidatus Omnitrophota bacterium]
MKQVVQNYKTGMLKVEEVPCPQVQKTGVLVKTHASFISVGTERTKVETARMNIIEKAISRLDLVKIVLNNVKQEGLGFTLKKAMNKLDMSTSLGYSCAGEVIEAGVESKEFKLGQRVACVGESYAAHAEVNSVPNKFIVPIPDNVDYSEASFVGLGAIALNAVELAQVLDNEVVVVIGLGLIGQMVIQILKAKNCAVLGIEIDEAKISLAKKLGITACINPREDDIDAAVNNLSNGKGAD